jgi:hypothetical protein
MVGTTSGGLGDPLVLQRTTHVSYVADFDFHVSTSAATAAPVVGTLNSGTEFVAGVVSLPDGRLWMQGWHAALTPNRWRTQPTTGGNVELPDTRYRFVPVSAEIDNGGAVILDSGEGERFLVQARCDRVVQDHELKCDDCSIVRLFNVVRALRGHGLSDEWIMTPNSGQVLGDGFLPQVFLDQVEDGPYNDAAIWISNTLESQNVMLEVIGPYLAVSVDGLTLEDPDTRAEYERLVREIERLRTRPSSVAVRVTALQLADDAALSAGILSGRPTALDVAELKAVAKPKLDRIMASMPGQANDLLNLRLAVHVRDYETSTATDIAVDDPIIGTLVQGEQLRWVTRDLGEGKMRIEVRAGMSVGPDDFEVVKLREGVVIERSRSSLAQMHATDDLAPGERFSTISPAAGADGELIVLIVERLN